MVEDVLKFKSDGKAVLEEYQETETFTDAKRRQIINILAAHMIDTHGYFIYFFKPNNCMAIVQIKIRLLVWYLPLGNTLLKQYENRMLLA